MEGCSHPLGGLASPCVRGGQSPRAGRDPQQEDSPDSPVWKKPAAASASG